MDELAERVRRAVRRIPPGTVVTYGDIAELVGTGPRQVGRIMATDASDTPWWRVVNASGRLPGHLMDEARAHWLAEQTIGDPAAPAVQLRRKRATWLLDEPDY
ncbi:MGMT family protein [Propionimicrobium sp. PCR01-08-3]|uniref:MGMT family protein n=1 Tax=Propionimicrobium sp. PCR01-08-3 TaxID=3052086 RepID=UPI00255CFE48|nr:MGMT family protein [Propionimicrobium sp. PCR01-08-3]WIY84268.1 MGMT family protein [Propionimicrobium sp. PCR01-08-3]